MAPFATGTNPKWWAQPRILLGTCLLLLSPQSENKLDTYLFFTTLGKVVVVLTAILVALVVNELSEESKVRPLKSGGFAARNVSDGKTAKRRPKKTHRTKPKKKRTSKKRKRINRRKRNTASTTLTRASPPKQPAVPNEAVYQVMRRACYTIFDGFELTVQRQRDNIQRLYYAVFRRFAQSEEQRRQCLERSGVLTRSPRRPDMAAAATRLTTFRNWPHPQSLPPERMAGAGFYYTGQRELVRCFYCNQHLEKWEAADDPWNEHSRHSPNCPYIQYVNAYLPADSLTMSEGDIRSLMDSQRRACVPARARDDDTSELRSRCWRCNSNDRQVVFPCGHKNVCWKCYQCPYFLESFQPLPTCCDCQRPFAEVFQDKIIQISVRRHNQMRRVRSGHQRGRCCR